MKLSLYRKYRPQTFQEVIGQDHIVKTLLNQVKNNAIGHAYLFTGIRGTGKTTIGRILSKTINCESENAPCGVCDACKDSNFNIIELDAASHNGVDNIREINEEVKHVPAKGKFKIYIIDEVHMLSTGAFNALLKTLEEPPAHVIFILATTDPQKIPATILSRVQRFNVKRIDEQDLCTLINDVCKKEGIKMNPEAVSYIASLGDGSARDTLSLLEQVQTSYFGEDIDARKVRDLIGAVDKFVYLHLTQGVLNLDFVKCVKIVASFIEEGRNIKVVVSEYIKYLRGLLFIKNGVSNGLDTQIYQGLGGIEIELLLLLIKEMSELEQQLRYNPSPILLELKLALLCKPQAERNNEVTQLKEKVNQLEQLISTGSQSNRTSNENINTKFHAYWNSIAESPQWKAQIERMDLNLQGDVYVITVPHYLISLEYALLKILKPYEDAGLKFNIVNR